MSTDITTFVGPFLACKYTFVHPPKTIHACVNVDCNLFNHAVKGKFCAECGKKIVQVVVDGSAVRSVAEPHDITFNVQIGKKFVPSLTFVEQDERKQEHWFVPNVVSRREKFGRHTEFDPRECPGLNASVTEADIAREKKWVEEKFAREITQLHSMYEAVEIRWGVLTDIF